MTRPTRVLAVVALLVVAGCAGGQQLSDDGQARQAAMGDDESLAATEAQAATPDGTSGAAAVRQNRELIRTAEATVEVENFDRARDGVAETVRSLGGFVGSSARERRGSGNRTWTEGRVVLRVPAENYSAAIRAVNETGEVVAFGQQTRDVTDQVVDLEARLANLRAERDQLRRLFEQANETEDVLAVQERLADVQSEIERTEAQLRQLERRVALSTITVRIEERPPERDEPEPAAWFDTPLTAAFVESVNGVVTTARAAAVLAAYALPYLLAFGLPLVGLAVGVRRFWFDDDPAPPDDVPPSPDDEPAPPDDPSVPTDETDQSPDDAPRGEESSPDDSNGSN